MQHEIRTAEIRLSVQSIAFHEQWPCLQNLASRHSCRFSVDMHYVWICTHTHTHTKLTHLSHSEISTNSGHSNTIHLPVNSVTVNSCSIHLRQYHISGNQQCQTIYFWCVILRLISSDALFCLQDINGAGRFVYLVTCAAPTREKSHTGIAF